LIAGRPREGTGGLELVTVSPEEPGIIGSSAEIGSCGAAIMPMLG